MQPLFWRMRDPDGWCVGANRSPRPSWRTQPVKSRYARWLTPFVGSASQPDHAREGRVCCGRQRSSATSLAGGRRNDLMPRANSFEADGWGERPYSVIWVGGKERWPSAHIAVSIADGPSGLAVTA